MNWHLVGFITISLERQNKGSKVERRRHTVASAVEVAMM